MAGVKETCPQQTVRAAITAAVETVCGNPWPFELSLWCVGVVKARKVTVELSEAQLTMPACQSANASLSAASRRTLAVKVPQRSAVSAGMAGSQWRASGPSLQTAKAQEAHGMRAASMSHSNSRLPPFQPKPRSTFDLHLSTFIRDLPFHGRRYSPILTILTKTQPVWNTHNHPRPGPNPSARASAVEIQDRAANKCCQWRAEIPLFPTGCAGKMHGAGCW